ncbi:hypothetical protein Tcan_05714 [Toxocara canis]|uniref:Uncharacterized protein n=1 Tax=Toxocara canis TaxID=6265 RepID=A0A0B2W4U7_TOXCA|nr:hypothetical protein Tcan_05714 [Toxocara canis]
MAWQSILLISVWTLRLVNGQPPPVVGVADTAVLAENAQKFVELYGLATQLMNFGGSLINNAKDYNSYGSSGNGILGEVVRPQLRGVRDYEVSPYKSLAPLSEYGGGLLGSGSSRYRSGRQSGLETLLNTFLGSSVSSSPSSPNIADFFSPSYQPESSRTSSGSNIDGIVNALIRSGAKQTAPDSISSQNILSQLFG